MGGNLLDGLPDLSARKIADEKTDGLSRKFIVSQVKPVQDFPINGVNPQPNGRMVWCKRHKYWTYSDGIQRETLFDLVNDPGEMYNLATNPEYIDVLKEYRKHLASWCEKYDDPFSKNIVIK